MRLGPIFLYGPPGAGKTTLGQALAEQLQRPFLDLDQEITRRVGKSIPRIFAEEGETHFRAIEKEILSGTLQHKQSIVALGGGSLLDSANRALVSRRGQVVCLIASVDTLAGRIAQGQTGRPLLGDQPLKNLVQLVKERNSHYLSFDCRVDVDAKTPQDLIWELQSRIGRFVISGMGRDYQVWIEPGGLDHISCPPGAPELDPPFFLVMDANVAHHHPQALRKLQQNFDAQTKTFITPAGEMTKNLQTVQKIWNAMLAARLDRGGTVFAVGGGVTGDLAGFAAATYMRGVAWVNLPTSLLAMVDASLGGKTGVDLQQGKNLIGAFHAPKWVLTDPHFLNTLPEDEFRNGMAEVIKHALIGDPFLLEQVKNGNNDINGDLFELISRAVAVKARIIVSDPYEQGQRESLNFGHTVGHAVEKLSGYHIRHGEAVSIGMVQETWLAEQIGLARKGLADEIAQILAQYDLPVDLPPGIAPRNLATAMQQDKKKRNQNIHFALPEEVGRIRIKVKLQNDEETLTKIWEGR